ncbi:MAG: phosphoribosylanthranilate isomerase, partial [Bacteroidota bacterium]
LQTLPIQNMGFIFYPKSARYVESVAADVIDLDQIRQHRIQKVGVFVNATVEEVLDKVETFQLDWVQLHGRETPAYCQKLQQLGLCVIKAFSVDADFEFMKTHSYESSWSFVLFDTKGKQPGGNGVHFDWRILERYEGNLPFFLSGGIGPEDLEAIQALNFPKLKAVDLNSRFELEPGQKDIAQLAKFVQALNPETSIG